MRIIEINPFFNENLIAKIHIEESSKWVDKIYISESNYSFQYRQKKQNYNLPEIEKVTYNYCDVKNRFKSPRKYIPHIDLKRSLDNKLLLKNTAWYNEMLQRFIAVENAEINDTDIVILGDIDEIIDSRFAQELIDEVKKRKIITVKLHLTLFYFNLFSRSWSGPPDYSFRLFLIEGKKFKSDFLLNYDKIRKMGERGQLVNSVFCAEKIAGFHHSWLGDSNFISQKLNAYAHTENAHLNDEKLIEKTLKEGKSLFEGHEVYINNDINLLESIKKNQENLSQYFL
jgi:hypothetical protein